MFKAGDIIPNGIHFNLPEDAYHGDPDALGSSPLKGLAVDPIEWQFNRLYGEDRDTDALIFGSAVHARILEGRSALNARFCQAFDTAAHKGALVTVGDLTAFLNEHGQTGLSKLTKPGLIQLALTINPDVQIADVLKQRWETANDGKKVLSKKRWAQVEQAALWAQRDPLLSAVMEDGTFIAGAPEVSFFYEEDGLRFKCRWDRWLRHAIVDVKTFAPWGGRAVEMAAVDVIERMGYDLQEAAYRRGWHRAKAAFEAGTLAVFGDEPVPGFLAEAFDRDDPGWIWVMVKSTGAPQPLVVDWKANFAKAAASDAIERAIQRYRDFCAEFGPDADWPPRNPALELTDTDLRSSFGLRR